MKRVVAACAILISITIISAMSVGWLLAHPVQTKIGNPPADLNAESVVFASASGATVHGWWCPNQNAKGAVLLLPGIRANRLSMVERARFLSRAGYSILLIDFQATGETTGDHITFGWKESRDVLAAVDFVRKTDSTTPVAIVGSSLGAQLRFWQLRR
jgi:alpha-beta hydrolase superfamily lysophospholipase